MVCGRDIAPDVTIEGYAKHDIPRRHAGAFRTPGRTGRRESAPSIRGIGVERSVMPEICRCLACNSRRHQVDRIEIATAAGKLGVVYAMNLREVSLFF